MVERFIKYYRSYHRRFELTEDGELIDYFIDLLDLNSDSLVQEVFNKTKIGSAYFQIKEPLLKEINFDKWKQLKNICLWEYNILLKMQDRGYDINKYRNVSEIIGK